MTDPQPFDINELYRHLRAAVRHGARASRLIQHVPEIIGLLYPPNDYPHLAEHARALNVENDIRRAVDDIGGNSGDAIAAVLGLPPGTLGHNLEERRRRAAHHLDIEPDTFRRNWNEKALLFDLAIEIYRHHNEP